MGRAAVRTTWRAAAVFRSAIETALTLRLVFRSPLRQAPDGGFIRSIRTVVGAGLDAPDHTTLSRRSHTLDVAAPSLAAKGSLHLIVDSTGLSMMCDGEWAPRNMADVVREFGRSCIWVSTAPA